MQSEVLLILFSSWHRRLISLSCFRHFKEKTTEVLIYGIQFDMSYKHSKIIPILPKGKRLKRRFQPYHKPPKPPKLAKSTLEEGDDI